MERPSDSKKPGRLPDWRAAHVRPYAKVAASRAVRPGSRHLEGRDIYLGKHGTPESRAEYDRVVSEWLANGRRVAATSCGTSDLAVNELVLAYLRFADGYYRKNGKPTNIRLAVRPILRLHGHSLARAFKWAVENELVPPTIHHGLKAVSWFQFETLPTIR